MFADESDFDKDFTVTLDKYLPFVKDPSVKDNILAALTDEDGEIEEEVSFKKFLTYLDTKATEKASKYAWDNDDVPDSVKEIYYDRASDHFYD